MRCGAQDYFLLLQALAPLHRTTRNLHLALQQARELAPDDRDLIAPRDQAADLERALDLLHGDARNGLDYTIAHQTEEQTRRTYDMAVAAYRLNLLAALFFPVSWVQAAQGDGKGGPREVLLARLRQLCSEDRALFGVLVADVEEDGAGKQMILHGLVDQQAQAALLKQKADTLFAKEVEGSEKFFKGGREVLEAIAAFWDGLEADRLNKVHV